MSLASLPMYDLPELRAETDGLWAALRDALVAHGIDAPDALDRKSESYALWRDPALCFSQTCGRPFRLGLHENVTLIGAPDYGVEGCPPGYYNSVLVVRQDDPREIIDAFKGAACAFNGRDSQSGYAAMLSLVGEERYFGRWHESGAHLRSVAAVALGEADIAAIDAVTWRLAERFDPNAPNLRVLTHSDPTPGLPYITAGANDATPFAEAVQAALATLDPATRTMLGIEGFVRFTPQVYLS